MTFRVSPRVGSPRKDSFSALVDAEKASESLSSKIHGWGSSGRFFWSVEFFPPKTDAGMMNLHDRILRLGRLRPAYMGITWGPEGTTAKATLDLCCTTQDMLGAESMLYLTCTNTPRSTLEAALNTARLKGLRNLFALRGAPHNPLRVSGGGGGDSGEFVQVADFVRFIRKNYHDDFCIAVSGYPEGFPGTPYEVYLQHLKAKVDAGADFIITQLVYSADVLLKFQQDCRNIGIQVPFVVGVMPIHTYRNFSRVVSEMKCVPDSLLRAIDEVKEDEEAVKDLGIKVIVRLISDLRKAGVCGFHFFSLNLEKSIMSILDQLDVLGEEQRRTLPWRMSANPLRYCNEEIRPIFWSNRSTSYLAKTMFWDEFPNGRWGDARSPAFGECDHHVMLSDKCHRAAFGPNPTRLQDVIDVFLKFLRNEIDGLPWFESPLQRESSLIEGMLLKLNQNGFLTINSQPRVDGARSDDPVLGWGPRGGYVYQKEYIEFFCCPSDMEILQEVLQRHPSVSYIASSRDDTFHCGNVSTVNAVTWGVFPAKEIIQPTVVDPYSFHVWKDEAFDLWLAPFTDTVNGGEDLPLVIEEIHNKWILVTMVENDYKKEQLARIFEGVFCHPRYIPKLFDAAERATSAEPKK